MVNMKGDRDAVAATIGVDQQPLPADLCCGPIGSSSNLWAHDKNIPLISVVVKEETSRSLQDGADVNVQDSNGRTALMRAVAGREVLSLKTLTLLIGDDVNIQDNDGKTALMYALTCRRELSLAILTQLIGKNVNVQDKNGYSSLMYAVSYDADVMFIETLLHKGADVGLKDNLGRTAMDLVIRSCPYKHFSYVQIVDNTFLRRLKDLVDLTYPLMSVELKVFVADYFINRSGLTFRKLCEENEELLHWMLHKCIVPKAIVPKEALKEPSGCESPLISAVILGHAGVVQHLVNVCCLTTRDFAFLKGLHRNNELRVTSEIRNFARAATFQPWSLQKLSILSVSTAVGNGPDRIHRVSTLQIPELLKKTLAYKKKN